MKRTVLLLGPKHSMLRRGSFYNRKKYNHVTPLLPDVLHWLPNPFTCPIPHRVQALSTRLSITIRSCSRVFARLLHCNTFLRAPATTAITIGPWPNNSTPK